MIKFIDISSWQEGIDLPSIFPHIDACVCKATEGIGLVDESCDKFIQTLIKAGKPWGFYHFANDNDPMAEADFLIENTRNYFGHGIPVLDWEGLYDQFGNLIYDQSVDWVNRFVRRVHDVTGIWPWIYANPWRFNQGGVEPNCMRWVAAYPAYDHPTFEMAEEWETPYADGLVGAWQFCSDGRIDGYPKNLDCNLFYGNLDAWNAYVGVSSQPTEPELTLSVLENDDYKVTIERKE